MNDPFENEVAVFGAARRLPVTDRAAYLDKACANDPALRQRIEALLQDVEEAEGFLQEPAPGAQRPEGVSTTPTLIPNPTAPGEKAGDRIGRYKLLQQIGEGGCGVVYMAGQEEPVRRRVALKIIKLGMDTKQVIARFEAERQALAMMDHSNIAKVLDAGATDTGRSYFVMELVRGIKITEYCDDHDLPTKERLELFMQVCHAVQHAHQKGIIHRDLKPSNILVASDDGVPVPKVIDFGIAKATQGRLTDQTLFTAFEQFLGTPAYVSPEQAELTMQDVDTRTDIYSLGVLLYELLTGRTPFDAQELLACGLDVMRQTIREQEPERPSTRLSTMLDEEQTTTARHRHTEAAKLIHALRGDLDWIVMKCLEKDRKRRYETASGLANDVQRHLSCEPVVARPPSKLYEFQKTVRRHKFGFGAAAALVLVLAAGVVVSTSQAIRATRAERQRSQSLRRAELAERKATEDLWQSYLAQARATRFSGQPGRRFDSLAVLTKAAAIRVSPELRDEAIACLALPDFKFLRRIDVKLGMFDRPLARYAAVFTNSSQISIRSVSDGQEQDRLPDPSGAGECVGLCRFSHNGKLLPMWYNGHLLRVWDLEHRAAVLTVTVSTEDHSVDFQPDDQALAVAGRGEVNLYDMHSGQKSKTFAVPFDPTCVRFSAVGHKLAVATYRESRLVILDANSGAKLLILTNAERLSEVAWHPRSSVLAVPGQETGQIYVWDTATGRQLFALRGHQSSPFNVAFSRNGDVMMSCGWDGTHLWHARTGEHLMSSSGQAGFVQSFAPGDNAYGHAGYFGPLELLAFAPGREARRWHASDEDRTSKLLAFSPDGRWLAFGCGDSVELFDSRSTDLVATLPTGPTLGLNFQCDRSGLLVSGGRGLFHWPIRAGIGAEELSIGPPQAIGPPGAWQQCNVSENGQVFAAFHGEQVVLFDASTLQELARTGACGEEEQFRSLSLNSDGTKLATGGFHDEVVRIWDTQTGALFKKLEAPEWRPEGSPVPVFEPNGRSLLIAWWRDFRLWDSDSWTPGPPRPRNGATIVALAHRGGWVATSDEGQTAIQLRDLRTGELLATLQSPLRDHFTTLAFSPDDTQLAAAHWGTRELIVWDLRLLRSELQSMGLDWPRPSYPPVEAEVEAKAFHIRVLTNSLPLSVPGG